MAGQPCRDVAPAGVEFRRRYIARARQVEIDVILDAARTRAHHQDTISHQYRLLHRMSDEDNGNMNACPIRNRGCGNGSAATRLPARRRRVCANRSLVVSTSARCGRRDRSRRGTRISQMTDGGTGAACPSSTIGPGCSRTLASVFLCAMIPWIETSRYFFNQINGLKCLSVAYRRNHSPQDSRYYYPRVYRRFVCGFRYPVTGR